MYNGFGFPTAIFAETDPRHHKALRDCMSPLFSKRAVDGLENLIADREDTLLKRIEAMSEKAEPIPIKNAFYCVTVKFP